MFYFNDYDCMKKYETVYEIIWKNMVLYWKKIFVSKKIYW